MLYDIVNDGYIRRRAMVFFKEAPKRWGAVLHDDELTHAIVDRILQRGRLLRIDVPSARTQKLTTLNR